MLSQAEARERLATVRAVIVDEWHELLGNKRGVQVELALARLRRWNPALAHLGALGHARQPRRGARRACSPGAPGRVVRGVSDKPVVIDTLIPARRRPLSRGRATSGSRCCADVVGGAGVLALHARLHQHALAGGDLVPGAPRGAAGLGGAGRAAPRLARRRRAALGGGTGSRRGASRRWSPPRASTSASTSRRWSACCRSAAPRASRGCCSAPAAPGTRRGRRAA